MDDYNSHLVARIMMLDSQIAKKRKEREELRQINLVLEKERAVLGRFRYVHCSDLQDP